MHPITTTRSGFAEPTPAEQRIAALEDHLARETRSSQALLAEVRRLQAWCTDDATILRLSTRVAELEALCKVLGVVPEFTPGTEPTFLPLADLRGAVVDAAWAAAEPLQALGGYLKNTGRTNLRDCLPPASMITTPITMRDPDGTVTEGTAYGRATAPGAYARNGKIVVVCAGPDKTWTCEIEQTFVEAVALREALTLVTAKGRNFFEAINDDEQAREFSTLKAAGYSPWVSMGSCGWQKDGVRVADDVAGALQHLKGAK